ncbi:DUF2442 domain-containing protein [Azospirillum rugosum]|uniref:DUF2442 domain-containing protein n=1 Tax=Azospirillum rugosum TaxID=416170 RepID=A0ABS4SKG2_9PROT|nr:DUF2442 domain-containing protein [Azospirillum rugosum]MBP2293054.1 hypothetical protein [Azospirillum rugosum]MDQ0526603.1 hypothetical protein [Azospirillum rugosum]
MSDEMAHGSDPRPILRIATVAAEPGHVLRIRWTDGTSARVDLSGWIGLHDVAELRDDAMFRQPEVGEFGASVQWAGNEDLSIDTLHLELLAEQQAPFGAAEIAAWQDRHRISNQEAADLLDVAVNTWMNYKSGATRVPRGVAIACRAMDRDPLFFTAHFHPRRNGRPPAAAE